MGAAILHVRSGRAVSRSSLASALGLAPSTAGLYVDQLINDGYVNEAGLERGMVGRPKRTLTTAARAGWFAGVEFNAERVQAVRVDFAGKLVGSEASRLPEDADAKSVLQAINGAVASLAKISKQPLLAVGVGAPGVVDSGTGVSTGYAFIPDWERVAVGDAVRKRFGISVMVENNLRAIALAERWFGGGRDLGDYVILGPRSGFGVALVQGGRVLRGAHHAAGEIGHWLWGMCGTGTSELQDGLSAPKVWRRLAGVGERARLPEDLRAALSALAHENGAARNEIVTDYARVVGCLQVLLDMEVYFLHGPLTALGQRFCGEVEGATRNLFPTLKNSAFRIIPSSLGDDAGALGAASLAMESWAPTSGERSSSSG